MNGTDFTTLPIGSRTSRGREVAVCPRCGRKGERIGYPDASENYTHRTRISNGFEHASDSCIVFSHKNTA